MSSYRALFFSMILSGTVIAVQAKGDWGYDDGQPVKPATDGKAAHSPGIKPLTHELRASPAGSLNAVPGTKPAKPTSTTITEKDSAAVEEWIELFGLVSKEKLADEQKQRFRSQLHHKLNTTRAPEVNEILKFWPEVEHRIGSNQEEKEAFASLFRSLLRYESRSKSIGPEDATILTELLGPERVAVPGDPALTEDSVDAYGDMACFMYEQAHPGKTVDALDNRTVFAAVIAGKFEHAPTIADKRAMANFSLTWAKFKVSYLISSGAEKQKLLEQVQAGKAPTVAKSEQDALISLIFGHGPWHTIAQ